jgi:hypothetical protein
MQQLALYTGPLLPSLIDSFLPVRPPVLRLPIPTRVLLLLPPPLLVALLVGLELWVPGAE